MVDGIWSESSFSSMNRMSSCTFYTQNSTLNTQHSKLNVITLFRRIRQKLIDSGSFTKYLLYAIGEILLVVIGILIALQVNNWNEERNDVAEAEQLTERLINDISNDKERLNYRITFFKTVMDFATQANEETELKKASDVYEKWEYLLAVFHTSQTWPFMPADATYNEIQNSGLLGYLGESDIQNLLSSYYIDNPLQLNQLVGGTQAYRDYSRSLIPVTIQKYIWKECFEIRGLDLQIFGDCELPAGEEADIEKVYDMISDDPNFPPLLTRRHATLLIREQIQSDMLKVADNVINQLKK